MLTLFPVLLWKSVFSLVISALLPFVHFPDCLHQHLICPWVYSSLVLFFYPLPCWFICGFFILLLFILLFILFSLPWSWLLFVPYSHSLLFLLLIYPNEVSFCFGQFKFFCWTLLPPASWIWVLTGHKPANSDIHRLQATAKLPLGHCSVKLKTMQLFDVGSSFEVSDERQKDNL